MVAMKTIKSVWQFLNKDLKDFGITGNRVETGAEASKASLELLVAFGLLLGAPLAPAGVAIAGLSFVGLTRKGLKVLREKKKKPSLEEWVAVAFPLAYVESFDSLVTNNLWLQEKFKSVRADLGARDSLAELGKLALHQSLIDEAMEDFPNSTLGRALNNKLATYLNQIKIDSKIISGVNKYLEQVRYAQEYHSREEEQKVISQETISLINNYLQKIEKSEEKSYQISKDLKVLQINEDDIYIVNSYLEKFKKNDPITNLVTGWTAWGVYPIIERLLENEEEHILQGLQMKASAAKNLRTNSKYYSIENYLKEQISPETNNPDAKALWQVFNEENVTLSDIYVSLEGKLFNEQNEIVEQNLVNLEAWVQKKVLESAPQVIFIQAGPGRGKSVFCRVFANWVRENLHPIWTPILIRLRDIDFFNTNLENILSDAVKADFVKSDPGWLHDHNTRFLFLLDGFDELRLEGREAGGIEKFLKQVEQYQQDCQRFELGHRFIVTGRQSALLGIVPPSNLQKVEIAPMSKELQEHWLVKWEKLVGEDKAAAFADFLEAEACPERVKELAQEPLLLYLLAAMCRDSELSLAMFEGSSSTEAKVLVYQTAIDWVLTEQRPEELNLYLTGQDDKEDLRLILSEASLCITQSGREWAALTAIETRLTKDAKAKELLEKARKRLNKEENPLRNFLAAFYLRPVSGEGGIQGAVEFIHKSFGEFLCAERMVESLQRWTLEHHQLRRRRDLVSDEQLAEEFYDLFGYGGLTKEIVEYLFALLLLEEEQLVKLFERCHNFYLDWWEGKFIDASPTENWSRKKLVNLKEQEVISGMRQIDVYTGLNALVLLFNLHLYAKERERLKGKITFHPCGQLGSKEFDPYRLRRIMNYSECANLFTFNKVVGHHLRGANLHSIDLSSTDLDGTSLEGVNLSNSKLRSARLREADLNNANISNAELTEIDLSGANLSGANLNNSDLSSSKLRYADLNSADLSDVKLRYADLNSADLSNAKLSCAYLNSANLSIANLSCTEFRGVDLTDADLRMAILTGVKFLGANLSGVNLTDTNLSDAELNSVNLSGAELKNISWNENTIWLGIKGLTEAKNVPEELIEQLTQLRVL